MVSTRWLSTIHEQLKAFSGTWQDKAVLDVGCGTGRLLLRGAHEAKSLTGIDISREMVRKANELFKEAHMEDKAKAIVGDAMNLPLSGTTYDLVFSTCALFLLPSIETGLHELRKATTPGGNLFFIKSCSSYVSRSGKHICEHSSIFGKGNRLSYKMGNGIGAAPSQK